ncbi:4Fe-4S dicluster domain-containing protein [Planctomycetales bacterium ZRK34]|nr:4Fe-4S dicluster domain-containing protein [Planctomycetales bacterium ZRK34]
MTQSAQTKSTRLTLDQRTLHQADVCVHCGLCLPACPTYTLNGNENDSPRGRIVLMKGLAEGRLDANAPVLKHLDLCLDCRGCETACPSGVIYHELIEESRAKLNADRKRRFDEKLIRWITGRVMTRPKMLKLALLPARLMQRAGLWGVMSKLTGAVLGPRVAKMQQMLPASGPLWPKAIDERFEARQPKKMTIGMLSGCVGSVMFGQTNQQTAELLAHLGCEVRSPREQVCCGAIPHHDGNPTEAMKLAKRNIEVFTDCDRIVIPIAGCGAMLKEYDHLLRDDPAWAQRAVDFVSRVRDISELICELDPPVPPHALPMRVTYHDACHLAHAQKITAPPRRLLAMIEGLEVVPLAESDLCCGAAGTYNLMQPEMSTDLAVRKIENIRATGANICVTGNVGCAMQIQSQADAVGLDVQVMHPVELLHRAYLGDTETTDAMV